jgi:hypothetical protein
LTPGGNEWTPRVREWTHSAHECDPRERSERSVNPTFVSESTGSGTTAARKHLSARIPEESRRGRLLYARGPVELESQTYVRSQRLRAARLSTAVSPRRKTLLQAMRSHAARTSTSRATTDHLRP